jgi:hypothetical protein
MYQEKFTLSGLVIWGHRRVNEKEKKKKEKKYRPSKTVIFMKFHQ